MNTIMGDNYLRENGLSSTAGLVLSTTAPNLNDLDDTPDYNDAFPQLTASGHLNFSQANSLFSSPFSASLNGSNSLMNPTTARYTSSKLEEDRRRILAIHEKLATTKIIEILPDERAVDHSRRDGKQSARTTGAPNSSDFNGQPIQKICTRIQKDTSTNITFFYKGQTLIVTVTGRPEQVRVAQVRIAQELEQHVRITVTIPFDFHRFIIGPRGATMKHLEQETLTRIAVPRIESQSDAIVVSGAKDNVLLCEQKLLDLYHTQLNKGFERLSIPALYHPWIRHQLVTELQRQLNVTIDLPPPVKQIDEISVRGEREPVEKAKATIMQFYKSMEGKIMTFPLEIPCEQHRFILGKKGAGLKEIFDKTNVVVRIPNQEDNTPTIQVMGEISRIGEAITMIYKLANALTAVQIAAPQWMHTVVRGERSANLDIMRKAHPDVRIFFRDDHIALEGPPEEVELVRAQMQAVIDDLRNTNITYLEVDIDPQYYKQLIGKNQIRLTEIQEKTGCDIKFPYDETRHVKLMGTKESVDKARQMLLERVQKLSNERTVGVSIDPQYYSQLIGAKGKKLEDLRGKFHNIQITFPEANVKSDKVTLHGDKDDVEKCVKFLQQKVKDLYSTDIEQPKRLYALFIGKSGANIQRLREQHTDVRIEVSPLDETKDVFQIHLNGKRIDVDKARKAIDENIQELNKSLENSIEQHISIDPKWHNKFFQSNRKLLNELQQQYGDALIKFPDRKAASNEVLLRGAKQAVEQLDSHLKQLIDTWENTITKEVVIPHRHHGYLLAQRGAYIQPLQKEHNVQIKFPQRHGEHDTTKEDVVRIVGRADDIEKAQAALEKMIPVRVTVDIPNEFHGVLVGKGGSQVKTLMEKYPDVQITFPPMNSPSNLIFLNGLSEQVEGFRQELVERFEKFQADQQARSFEVRFKIKSEHRSLVIGRRWRTINNLQEKYNVKIQILTNQGSITAAVVPTQSSSDDLNHEQQHDDQQALPVDNHSLDDGSLADGNNEIEILIIGYEDKAIECRNEILRLINDFELTITMEIEIDPRVHARIIGARGQRLQQLMKDFTVDVKFPSSDKPNNKVHVVGKNQGDIDACIDRLLILEEDFLEDLDSKKQTESESKAEVQHKPNVQRRQQEVPSTTHKSNKMNDATRQKTFKVKNAPWASAEYNYDDQQQDINREQMRSPRKGARVLNHDNFDEYPAIMNGAKLTTNDDSSEIPETTVNRIPVIWGPQKRNK